MEKRMHAEIAARCTGPCGFLEQEYLRDYVCIADGHCDIHRSLVMRRLDVSKNLEAIVRESDPLQLGEMYAIICQIAARLEALHNANICHGDAKAKNIILTDSGPIFIDFGLSDVLTEANRTEATHADCRQLLWLVLQLRFHLPFKHKRDRQGLMDTNWDLFREMYTLCGPVFDKITSNRDYTIQNVLEVARDLFGPKDLSRMYVYPHCNNVWEQIFDILQQLQRDHNTLKGTVNELQMSDEVRNLKLTLNNIINDHRIGFRQLFSIEREEDVINRAQSLQQHLQNKHNEFRHSLESIRNL